MNHINGWLIYNGGLLTPKFLEINEWYRQSALKQGIQLDLLKNTEVICEMKDNQFHIHLLKSVSEPDFILFLDKDIRLAKQLERLGYRLFNSSSVIETCDDKIQSHQALGGLHLKMPNTLFSPMMFKGPHEENNSFIDQIEQEFRYPLVVKEAYGSFGDQVYLIENRQQLIEKRKELLYIPHLYQEYIASSKGKDVRIHVVGDRVVASMFRYSESDFRANVSQGGKMKPFDPPQAFKNLAIKASLAIGATFSGVDLLFGENGEPVFCEINSNAHIINIFNCTGINVADFIFEEIKRKLG